MALGLAKDQKNFIQEAARFPCAATRVSKGFLASCSSRYPRKILVASSSNKEFNCQAIN